ncbi:MAG: hypothetical protein GY779_09405 [Gammaproteobacteria bacterium]|nr:hypothetical protein [Gammaproteobacteria bacterium]
MKNSYDADGEWERELFIESSSFAASAITGWAAVTFLVVATPVGWVALIAGAAAASMIVNSYTKERSGFVYDKIMDSIQK